jgi:hypothetical protein
LCVIERAHLPFPPKRFYYLYDIPADARRAGHAHFTEHELMVALGGSFSVLADDGCTRTEFRLDRPDLALHIPPLVWHEVHSFTPGSVCAVLASTDYDAREYCRDYAQFLEARRA